MHDEMTDFSNTEIAFSSYSEKDLGKSYWLYRLMNNPFLVRIANTMAVFGLKMKLPINWLIKKTVFRQFCGGETIEQSMAVVKKLAESHIFSILDYSVESGGREADYDATAAEIVSIINTAGSNRNISYTSLKMNGLSRHGLMEKLQKRGVEGLTAGEKEEYGRIKARLENICWVATEKKVPFYVDAEESWIQGSVDELVLEMMRKYNREWAVVSTTLQMYIRDKIQYLHKCFETAEKEGFYLGVKFVRGAYWEKERKRAALMGYPSPVYDQKKDTDEAYNEAISFSLNHIDRIVVDNATHNEESSMLMAKLMDEKDIARNHPHAWFSQLMGMSDHISYNLADAGYNVSKYIPYGPVRSVLPYLIRRAQENTAISGQMSRELRLIIKERKRRKQKGRCRN